MDQGGEGVAPSRALSQQRGAGPGRAGVESERARGEREILTPASTCPFPGPRPPPPHAAPACQTGVLQRAVCATPIPLPPPGKPNGPPAPAAPAAGRFPPPAAAAAGRPVRSMQADRPPPSTASPRLPPRAIHSPTHAHMPTFALSLSTAIAIPTMAAPRTAAGRTGEGAAGAGARARAPRNGASPQWGGSGGWGGARTCRGRERERKSQRPWRAVCRANPQGRRASAHTHPLATDLSQPRPLPTSPQAPLPVPLPPRRPPPVHPPPVVQPAPHPPPPEDRYEKKKGERERERERGPVLLNPTSHPLTFPHPSPFSGFDVPPPGFTGPYTPEGRPIALPPAPGMADPGEG